MKIILSNIKSDCFWIRGYSKRFVGRIGVNKNTLLNNTCAFLSQYPKAFYAMARMYVNDCVDIYVLSARH